MAIKKSAKKTPAKKLNTVSKKKTVEVKTKRKYTRKPKPEPMTLDNVVEAAHNVGAKVEVEVRPDAVPLPDLGMVRAVNGAMSGSSWSGILEREIGNAQVFATRNTVQECVRELLRVERDHAWLGAQDPADRPIVEAERELARRRFERAMEQFEQAARKAG